MTASQKFAVIAMPVAAIGLAVVTSDPEWSPKRTRYGSLREAQMRLLAPPAAAAIPAAPEAGDPSRTPPADPAAKKDPAAKPAPAEAKPAAKSPAPAPAPAKDPSAPKEVPPAVPAPPAAKKEAPPPVDSGVEFRASGLVQVRFAEVLRVPLAERLDVYVLQSGEYKVGADFLDAAAAKEAIAGADAAKKASGLLYIVPNARAPWDSVKGMILAGYEAGWTRVGLCVSFADDAGRGRVFPVDAPTTDAATIAKGLDALTVTIAGASPSPAYTLNGDPCSDPAGLAFNAKAMHDEYEVMEKDYSADVETTPWSLDPAGASAGGVIAGVDALKQAGVKAVRIAGLKKTAR